MMEEALLMRRIPLDVVCLIFFNRWFAYFDLLDW